MRVPIKEAMATGDWLNCAYDEIKFKIRLFGFSKVESKGIVYLNNYEDPTELWHVKAELINMTKTSFNPYILSTYIVLLDQDDFEFNSVNNDIWNGSDYSKKYNLNTFRINAPFITPKIKTTGTLAYKLPEDNEAEYFITIKGGAIQGE